LSNFTKQNIVNFINLRGTQLIARFILGGVFIYASLGKIAFPREFANIVIKYRILPEKLAIYFAFLLPWVELILGIFLVIGLYVRESVLALASLLLVFMAAMIIGSLNGTLNSCGCFSIKPSHPESLFLMLTRDILLLFGFLILYINLNYSRISLYL
jgi:uncharacterized membrane protein YphA (DoxX/SURF4 family)